MAMSLKPSESSKDRVWRQVHCKGIDLGDGVVIEETNEEGYKYLGNLERDDICQEKMKEKVQKEYYKRVGSVLKSKLNGGNVINAINIWAVAMVSVCGWNNQHRG